jgi:hypothetical protein
MASPPTELLLASLAAFFVTVNPLFAGRGTAWD